MTYKILIVKNRYKKRVQLVRYFDWFKTNLGLTIQADEIETDFDLTTAEVGNATWKGAIAGNLHEVLRGVVPENTYHAVVVVYGNDLAGIRLSAVNGTNGRQNLYLNTEIVQLAKLNEQTFNHELFHAFISKANRFGANIQDPMDICHLGAYYRDNILDLNNGETNRTIAIRNLTTHWEKVLTFFATLQPMKPTVTITRTYTENATYGEVSATNGAATFTCKSLELPWKANQRNISCIPKGTYEVVWGFSPSRMRWTYRIQNVPGRSGILFHAGNYAYKKTGKPDIEGCILLGNVFRDLNGDNVVDIGNSVVTLRAFEGFLGKKPFTLIIR